jgi:hypothetical protein
MFICRGTVSVQALDKQMASISDHWTELTDFYGDRIVPVVASGSTSWILSASWPAPAHNSVHGLCRCRCESACGSPHTVQIKWNRFIPAADGADQAAGLPEDVARGSPLAVAWRRLDGALDDFLTRQIIAA